MKDLTQKFKIQNCVCFHHRLTILLNKLSSQSIMKFIAAIYVAAFAVGLSGRWFSMILRYHVECYSRCLLSLPPLTAYATNMEFVSTTSNCQACPAGATGLYPTDQCLGYRFCVDGVDKGTSKCPAGGLLFDEKFQNCNWASQVTCNCNGVNPPPTPPPIATSPPPTPPNPLPTPPSTPPNPLPTPPPTPPNSLPT